MPKVTQLPGQREGLTSAHRCLISALQDLCIDVSAQNPDVTANCQYNGKTHEVYVTVFPRGEHRHRLLWSDSVYLPGRDDNSALDTSHAIEELAALLERLRAYLPSSTTPGGAA